MFVKLTVLACFVAAGLAQHQHQHQYQPQPQPKWNGPLAGGEPASKYPAGVSPQACPNFPNCANPALAANPSAPAPAPVYNNYQGHQPSPVAYNAAPHYNVAPAPAPVAYNQAPAHYNNNGGYKNVEDALNNGEYVGDGDYKGEGLAESGAFGPVPEAPQHAAPTYYNAAPIPQHQQYNQGAYHGAPVQASGPAPVPAGVDPKSCPNYPYCH